MLKIKNGKVYLDGIATTNPELIGLALLDMAENNESISKEETKSSKDFDKDCLVYLDTAIDMWVCKYLGKTVKCSKSKFDCLIEKKLIQKRVGA